MPYDVEICEKSISELEKLVMEFWRKKNIFQKSVQRHPKYNSYVLYDGPPFATGLPHYGHVLAHSIKDVLPRYHTMQGKRVERRFGWDCHGVPVEYEVEKEFKIHGTVGIEKMGIAEFNEKCRSIVLRYTKEWRVIEERLGRFIDMDNDYKTMEKGFMNSVWAVFYQLQEKGLIYEGKKIVAYSPELGTPLSDFEAKLNYKKIQDPAITMQFPLVNDPNTSFLVWTTTPWSVPTNVAIALNPKLSYVKVYIKGGKNYILVKDAIEKYFKKEDILKIKQIELEELLGKQYVPMFNLIPKEQETNCYKIVESDHVIATDGTGLVHISPAHGEDDYKIGQIYNLPILDFTDRNCVFHQIPEVQGQFFKEADKTLIKLMKAKKRILKHETISHEYPFCWRTDKPLMYRAIPSWYVKVTAIKNDLIENNKKINWYPNFIGQKRFHNWLESAKDWAISRNRYWGCPIPIWRNVNDPADCIFIKSAEELENLMGIKIKDLHRHYIDHLVIQKDGKVYQRIPEVFDCWFESGAMPYAQDHYMFENEQEFLETFPADFIAEGADQTRGWFYTLNVLSTALYNKPAFKNCVVNGILLGNDGKKMSKSKGNYPKLDLVFEKYGADALRFLLLGSPATNAQELAVDEKQIANNVRQVILPMLNIYKFFAIYANQAGFRSDDAIDLDQLKDSLNKWLIYRIELFKANVTAHYDKYNLIGVCQEIKFFIEDLSNWYLHNNRDAFSFHSFKHKQLTLSKTQKQPFQCLHYALHHLSLCCAPIIPFISEVIYQCLHGTHLSVHLQDWPKLIDTKRYSNEYESVELVKKVVHLGQRVREENSIRLRQPLSVVYLDKKLKKKLSAYEDFIKEGLNVKSIEWVDDASGLLDKKITLNFSILGKTYRSDISQIKKAFEDGNYTFDNNKLIVAGKILSEEEFNIHFIPKVETCGIQKENLWVVFNTHLTPELIKEGEIRDLIRNLQNMRKEAGYQITQHVEIYVGPELLKMLSGFEDYLQEETNCEMIHNQPPAQVDYSNNININGTIEIISFKLSAKQNNNTSTTKYRLTQVKNNDPLQKNIGDSRGAHFSLSQAKET